MKTKYQNRIKNDMVFDGINTALLAILGIVTAYPFYYVLIYSFSDPTEAIRGVYFLPKKATIYNYIHIFTNSNLQHAAFISLARTLIGAVLTVLGSSIFAYAMSKENTPFRKFIYRASIATMYFSAGMIPWYLTMRAYGLQNNFFLYVVPSIVVVFFVILIKTFFEQLPKELEESAKIDGAGQFTILFSIILPLSVPILATVFIFSGSTVEYLDGQFSSEFQA